MGVPIPVRLPGCTHPIPVHPQRLDTGDLQVSLQEVGQGDRRADRIHPAPGAVRDMLVGALHLRQCPLVGALVPGHVQQDVPVQQVERLPVTTQLHECIAHIGNQGVQLTLELTDFFL